MSHDEANGALLEESASQPSPSQPSPALRPNRGVRNLFFSGSQPEEELAERFILGEGLPETPSPFPPGDVSDSDDEWPSDPDESLSETSSSASSADGGGGPLKPLGKAALRSTTRKGVLIATSAVHRIAARHELEREAGLYIADEQDQELIGDPIANLLHRRGGIVGKQMSEDANDAISALMGVANFIGKQMALTAQIGQLKAAGAVVGEVA